MKRILVAEDNEANREVLREYLEPRGFEIIEACDGEEAVQRIRESPPDLILLDVQMPRVDGFAVLRLLKEQGVAVPVIALTAHAMEGDRERALLAGFDGYHSKPVDLQSLLAEIRRRLA